MSARPAGSSAATESSRGSVGWARLGAEQAARELEVDPEQGLSSAEAAARLARFGPNELIERGGRGRWRILAAQLSSTLVILLIAAAVVSALLGDYQDAVAILAIVALNAWLGVHQEYKAEQAMAALRRMAAPTVKVRRDGRTLQIESSRLAPGDVILLEAGDAAPADARLLESANLRTEEAPLTGESEPVDKDADFAATADMSVGDLRNMIFRGSTVVHGRGVAAVVATGMRTELGRIADLLQTVEDDPTPLQRRLSELGRVLIAAALVIVTVVFTLGLLRGEDFRLMFLTAVSLAVAAVPEGLPAVVTIALALGAQRMLRRRALIRKLPAVETLGSVTVICSDKTGTLTQNRMTVTRLGLPDRPIDAGNGSTGGPPAGEDMATALLYAAAALCNDSQLGVDHDRLESFEAIGDPTETALAVAAAQAGFVKPQLERALPRQAEAAFDSRRKRMTVVHRRGQAAALPRALESALADTPFVAFTKGAVDGLLDLSTATQAADGSAPLDAEGRARILKMHDQLAQDGLRVLGLAWRPLSAAPNGKGEDLEAELTFIGMIAMADPPRPEVKQAVETCQAAGVRTILITGDHPLTARHVARQLGILEGEELLTGRQLDGLSPEEFREVVRRVTVYARVSPEHKLKIVEALQEQSQIVAMTGDGVNDAPALKKADIGVAMGVTGTDVSKQASDIVLEDDNFATIVAAVEEGRTIYENIRKFMKYLLSANAGELAVMLGGPFAGMPLPLLPLQILWMNLITDGPPALALGIEPAEGDVMRRPPRAPGESLFAQGLGRDIVLVGLTTAVSALAVGYFSWAAGSPAWQTSLFTTLTLAQLVLALAVRTRRSFFTSAPFANPALIAAVLFSAALHLAVVYAPFLQSIFKTQALSAAELGVAVAASTAGFFALEAVKAFDRRREALAGGRTAVES